ncbi:hypothetical protein BABINDRAFT_170572 [Babjeviella inositovora NRRL Y-12698]|uniref:Chloride channel protein n=1 Tax=Babjeviella inositovora NRRL Y-12698 TaxID=984486 RepID=A0A1E3QWE7_9ASCO|nr:uncharacterized protein BABINDRAFT_170572 [Babjeviella inositovora NRRL Y-12698]ODQ82009.1 hypothetical protein BABINDRAFT_170572 [Babjeviella inositovora NRRL Y-12698]
MTELRNRSRASPGDRFDEFTTIDWVEDNLKENQRQLLKASNKTTTGKIQTIFRKIKLETQSWLVLTLIGVFIGIIAGCLNIFTAWLVDLKSGRCSTHFYLGKRFCCWGETEANCTAWVEWSRFAPFNYVLFVLFSVAFSSSAALLVKHYAPSAAGSGISEIKCIVSGFRLKGFLGWWTLAIKSIGLPLTIASGLSVGKEGPSVHYAACAGNCITSLFKTYQESAAKSRDFLAAAAAAGVAVAFGSPMGGVLFSIEEISNVFKLRTMWSAYFCALAATTTLSLMNPFRTGQLVLFEVSYDKQWHVFEIPFFIILGAFGGVYGIVVSRFNIYVVSFRKRYLASFAIREVVLLTSLTAMFCYFNEFLRLDMTESMQILFHECNANWDHRICDLKNNSSALIYSLIFATAVRMLLVVVSYGCKVPAGIFVPSMAAGATFGRALGILVQAMQTRFAGAFYFRACDNGDALSCITPGTYAFLGAGAALSGITHLTVTVVVIMFELTGALKYILPTMIVVAVTKSINDKWGHGGIADQMIRFNGLPFIDNKEDHDFNAPTVKAMSTPVVAFPAIGLRLSELQNVLRETPFADFPVVESLAAPHILGYISRQDVRLVEETFMRSGRSTSSENSPDFVCKFAVDGVEDDMIDFSAVVNLAPLLVTVSMPLETTLDIFHKLGPRFMLVETEGVLSGIITQKDVLRFEAQLHNLAARIRETLRWIGGGLQSENEPAHHANPDLIARIWETLRWTGGGPHSEHESAQHEPTQHEPAHHVNPDLNTQIWETLRRIGGEVGEAWTMASQAGIRGYARMRGE